MPTAFSSPIELFNAIREVWAADTASPPSSWSVDNPAKNHCSVTSLVVQDLFGGDILCTKTVGGTHFYNRINGSKWDLTVSQFAAPIPYDDVPATRAEALADTSERKYLLLSERLQHRLSNL
jgi:hypothetical protein